MTATPKKITTLIVDDEPLARRNIRLLLKDDPEHRNYAVKLLTDAKRSR